MRVLSVHAGADTGGCNWGLTGAFARHSGIELRSSARMTNYIDYPGDLAWDDAVDYARSADIVHLHNTFRTARILEVLHKPLVIHHHGTHYREHARPLNREVLRRGARAVVSTLDLLEYGPDLTWCPAAYDLDWVAAFRAPRQGRLRVGHCPTDRAIKSTAAFLAACERLDVEPVLVERAAWTDCLSVKGTCDVYFDQVILGYGGNAIEAWAMGIPVIAGAAASTLERMRDTFDEIPFMIADESSIGDAITAMTDPATRADYAARGRAHVRRWHDGRATVDRLTDIYASLVEQAA